MQSSKLNTVFNKLMFFLTTLIIILIFISDIKVSLIFEDLLLILLSLIAFIFLFYFKRKNFKNQIILYDFVIMICSFTFNIKITIIIVALSLPICYLIDYIYYIKYSTVFQNKASNEIFMIINSLFLTYVTTLLFFQLLNFNKYFFKSIITFSVLFNLFYYLFYTIDLLLSSTKMTQIKSISTINLILKNLFFTTSLAYFILIFDSYVNYFPIMVFYIIFVAFSYYFNKYLVAVKLNNNLKILTNSLKTSITSTFNFDDKMYSYVDAINRVLPSSIIGVYLNLQDQTTLYPLSYKCEENIRLKDLKLNTFKLNDLNIKLETGVYYKDIGKNLVDVFPFVKKLNLLDDTLILSPIELSNKLFGCVLVIPKYIAIDGSDLNLISNLTSSLSLLLESYTNGVIRSSKMYLSDLSELNIYIEALLRKSLTFTVSNIFISHYDSDTSLDDCLKLLTESLSNKSSNFDKILIIKTDNYINIYIVSPFKDYFNTSNNLIELFNMLATKENNLNINYCIVESPYDATDLDTINRIIDTNRITYKN